jgi:flagellar L-ring protein precursor FlgH
MRFFLFSLFLAYFIIGCSSNISRPINVQEPDFVRFSQVKKMKIQKNEGSLYVDGDINMFGDNTARRINDLISVIINQKSSLSIKSGKGLSRSTSKVLTGGGVTSNSSDSTIGAIVKGINDLTNFGFQGDSASTFKGSGSTNRTDNLITNVSARIVKILKNNNYFIVGTRNTMINNQVQILYVSGVIRANDINNDNSIDSKYIADAKIIYLTDGDLTNQNKLPWGLKLTNELLPY